MFGRYVNEDQRKRYRMNTSTQDQVTLLAAHEQAIAAASKDPSLSPETGRKVSKGTLFRFGAGFLIFGILWMSGSASYP